MQKKYKKILFDLDNTLVNDDENRKCAIKKLLKERNELLKQNEEIKKELDYIKATTEKQMYINDLNELKKELTKDIK